MNRRMTSIAALIVFILVIAAVPCNAGDGNGIAQADSVLSSLWSGLMETMTGLTDWLFPGNPPPDGSSTSGRNGGYSADDNGWEERTGGGDNEPNEQGLHISDEIGSENSTDGPFEDNGWVDQEEVSTNGDAIGQSSP